MHSRLQSMSMSCNAAMMGQVVFYMGHNVLEILLYTRLLVKLYVIRARLSYVLHLLALHQSSYLEAIFHTPVSMSHYTSHCNILKNGFKAGLLP